MKKLLTTLFGALVFLLPLSAQIEKYQTFIYTDEHISDDIENELREQRGLGKDILNAGLSALKGIGSGYISTFVDMGVNAIGALITKESRDRQAWEETVMAENKFSIHLGTVSQVDDFYKKPSRFSPMDPSGMKFNGIGCLRMDGPDTAFFISCHINREKLKRIVNHSKFELVLDTLVVSPFHSNLPNTRLNIPFSFQERDHFVMTIRMKLTSSWMDQLPQINDNKQLGEFVITLPILESDLDSTGFLRYARKKEEKPKFTISGESFIVPRSYMAIETRTGGRSAIWGTGEYRVAISIEEKCELTEEFRKNWKADAKKRKAMAPKKNVWTSIVQYVSNQKWDEITQSWVVTTLKAPAGVLTDEIIKDLDLKTDTKANATGSAPQVKSGTAPAR